MWQISSCLRNRNHRTAWDSRYLSRDSDLQDSCSVCGRWLRVPCRCSAVRDTLHAHRLQDRAFGSILLSGIVSLGSRRRMQRFLQFWLGCHGLPIAAGRLAGAGLVDRANRVCLTCNSGAIGDEKHMIFECTALSLLRQQHACLFTPALAPCAPFSLSSPSFAHNLGVLNCVIDCLNYMNI